MIDTLNTVKMINESDESIQWVSWHTFNCSLLGFGLLVCHSPNEDGIRRNVADVIRFVEERGSDGQVLAVRREAKRRYAGRVFVELAKSLLVESIPYVYVAVGTSGGESVVPIVKTDGIHGIYHFNTTGIVFVSVTLKRIFLSLYFWTRI